MCQRRNYKLIRCRARKMSYWSRVDLNWRGKCVAVSILYRVRNWTRLYRIEKRIDNDMRARASEAWKNITATRRTTTLVLPYRRELLPQLIALRMALNSWREICEAAGFSLYHIYRREKWQIDEVYYAQLSIMHRFAWTLVAKFSLGWIFFFCFFRCCFFLLHEYLR